MDAEILEKIRPVPHDFIETECLEYLTKNIDFDFRHPSNSYSGSIGDFGWASGNVLAPPYSAQDMCYCLMLVGRSGIDALAGRLAWTFAFDYDKVYSLQDDRKCVNLVFPYCFGSDERKAEQSYVNELLKIIGREIKGFVPAGGDVSKVIEVAGAGSLDEQISAIMALSNSRDSGAGEYLRKIAQYELFCEKDGRLSRPRRVELVFDSKGHLFADPSGTAPGKRMLRWEYDGVPGNYVDISVRFPKASGKLASMLFNKHNVFVGKHSDGRGYFEAYVHNSLSFLLFHLILKNRVVCGEDISRSNLMNEYKKISF